MICYLTRSNYLSHLFQNKVVIAALHPHKNKETNKKLNFNRAKRWDSPSNSTSHQPPRKLIYIYEKRLVVYNLFSIQCIYWHIASRGRLGQTPGSGFHSVSGTLLLNDLQSYPTPYPTEDHTSQKVADLIPRAHPIALLVACICLVYAVLAKFWSRY